MCSGLNFTKMKIDQKRKELMSSIFYRRFSMLNTGKAQSAIVAAIGIQEEKSLKVGKIIRAGCGSKNFGTEHIISVQKK